MKFSSFVIGALVGVGGAYALWRFAPVVWADATNVVNGVVNWVMSWFK